MFVMITMLVKNLVIGTNLPTDFYAGATLDVVVGEAGLQEFL